VFATKSGAIAADVRNRRRVEPGPGRAYRRVTTRFVKSMNRIMKPDAVRGNRCVRRGTAKIGNSVMKET